MVPIHRGEMAALCGLPGNGKTTLMAHLARIEAQRIVEREAEDEVVVFVSFEQSVEEVEAFFAADEEVQVGDIAWARGGVREALVAKGPERWRQPIWAIGTSVDDVEAMRTPLTLDVLLEELRYIREMGHRINLVCIDYVQIIPVPGVSGKVERVHDAVVQLKALAKAAGIPVVMGVQARFEVFSYRAPIPTLRDGQWASGIGQTVDKFFGIWRPVTTYPKVGMPDHEPVYILGQPYDVTDTLLVIKMWKQRMESPQGTWALYFDPARMILEEMECTLNTSLTW